MGTSLQACFNGLKNVAWHGRHQKLEQQECQGEAVYNQFVLVCATFQDCCIAIAMQQFNAAIRMVAVVATTRIADAIMVSVFIVSTVEQN